MRELEQYFKALGDNNRLRIINLLLHGELCVCDIQYVLENSQPNVSRHLAYLKNSGMVTRSPRRLSDLLPSHRSRRANQPLALLISLRRSFGDENNCSGIPNV